MLNRLSVNFILKSVIASLMAVIVCRTGGRRMGSWRRLGAINRIASVAEATAYMFTALHNLRVDRATTSRDLDAEQAGDHDAAAQGRARRRSAGAEVRRRRDGARRLSRAAGRHRGPRGRA